MPSLSRTTPVTVIVGVVHRLQKSRTGQELVRRSSPHSLESSTTGAAAAQTAAAGTEELTWRHD